MSQAWMKNDLEELSNQGLRRRRRLLRSRQGPRVRIGKREYVNFASNDYLSLAGDARLARAAARAARRYGVGAGASPLVTGRLTPHALLERRLARFEDTQAALVFSSGYAANLALLSTLAGPGDVVFSDQLNHASIIDGCRLSRAEVHVHSHADASHAAELLHEHGPRARRRFLVTDSVFSMDGDLAPLRELAELAERHDAILIVDEAHATGVFGANGRGLTDGLDPQLFASGRIIKMATLSKALGAQGGFVCGPRLLCDYLYNRARPYVFSTALATPTCAAASAAVRIVADEPERRLHVLRLAAALRAHLRDRDFDIGQSQSHIVPILVGDPANALALSRRLRKCGYLVPAIRPPSVPAGTSRLRISVTAGHREEDVAGLVAALEPCRALVATASCRTVA